MTDTLIADIFKEDIAQAVMESFGMRDMPPEDQETMMLQMDSLIRDRLSVELLKALPEDARETFVALIGSDDFMKLYGHLAQHIPDVDAFIAQTIAREVADMRATFMSELGRTHSPDESYV